MSLRDFLDFWFFFVDQKSFVFPLRGLDLWGMSISPETITQGEPFLLSLCYLKLLFLWWEVIVSEDFGLLIFIDRLVMCWLGFDSSLVITAFWFWVMNNVISEQIVFICQVLEEIWALRLSFSPHSYWSNSVLEAYCCLFLFSIVN